MSNDNTAKKSQPAAAGNAERSNAPKGPSAGGPRGRGGQGGGAGPMGPGGPMYPGAAGQGQRRGPGQGQRRGPGQGPQGGPGGGQNPQQQMRQNANAREAQFLFQQAQQMLRQGNQQEAAGKLRECIQMAPNHVGALRALAHLRFQAGDQQTATQLISRALRADPNNDEVLCDVAMALENSGRVRRAEQHYQKAVRINPRNMRAQMGMGRVARRSGNIPMAEYHFRQAFSMNPRAPGVAATLGNLLSNMGRKDEAERFFRIATALFPNDYMTLLSWAKMEESRNDLEMAERLVNIVKEKQPDSPGIGMSDALLARRNKEFDKALEAMDTVQVDRLQPGMQASYWYERGGTLDKLERYDEAFEAYSKANQINRDKVGMRYRGDHNQDMARGLREVFSKENVEKLPRATPKEGDQVPIFICGFTRSGTSLVEQTLGSHSQIAPGDELHFVAEWVHRAPMIFSQRQRQMQQQAPQQQRRPQQAEQYPKVLLELTKPGNAQLINRLREHYIGRARMAAIMEPGVTRFTDKMPMNEMHMGLIQLVFPDTHFLHMIRHPLDNILSSFFIDARHGDMCTYDLETAARHYALLQEMVAHYLEVMPEIKYLRVRYEDVVADHKGETEKMLKFLELPWEDACEEYYKTKRQPRTPSYAQVKEKIYTDSTFRYKNYRKHVDKIIPVLEPWIKAYGYTVE